MAQKLTLVELKEMVRLTGGLRERSLFPFSLFPAGLPAGGLVEIVGCGKVEFLITFLRERMAEQETRTAWIEESFRLNPFALWQQGLSLDPILFVDMASSPEGAWAIQQILQSQLFRNVVLSGLHFSEKDLRRFQLLVEKYGGFLILLNESPHKSWVPLLQLQVEKTSRWDVQVLRQRGHG